MTTYVQPATPLPWLPIGNGSIGAEPYDLIGNGFDSQNRDYIIRASNAFPALVEALEIIFGQRQCVDSLISNKEVAAWALAYARGEKTP